MERHAKHQADGGIGPPQRDPDMAEPGDRRSRRDNGGDEPPLSVAETALERQRQHDVGHGPDQADAVWSRRIRQIEKRDARTGTGAIEISVVEFEANAVDEGFQQRIVRRP
jgi:hypothetical protein